MCLARLLGLPLSAFWLVHLTVLPCLSLFLPFLIVTITICHPATDLWLLFIAMVSCCFPSQIVTHTHTHANLVHANKISIWLSHSDSDPCYLSRTTNVQCDDIFSQVTFAQKTKNTNINYGGAAPTKPKHAVNTFNRKCSDCKFYAKQKRKSWKW